MLFSYTVCGWFPNTINNELNPKEEKKQSPNTSEMNSGHR